MELALILLVLVIAELVVSVFMITRWSGVRKELALMESAVSGLADALRIVAAGGDGLNVPVTLPEPEPDMTRLGAATEILNNATEADVAKALELLRGLNVGE